MATIGISPRRRLTALAASGIVVVLVAALYLATFDFRGVSDTHLNSLQTRSLVRHGDIDLARYGTSLRGHIVHRGPHVYSIYGAGISLFAAPLYLVATRLGAGEVALEGATATVAVAGAAAVLFVLLLRLVPQRIAAAGTVVFAFGTTMWPVAAMGLFQHGPVALFQTVGLTGLFSRRSSAPLVAGLGFGAAALIRSAAAIPLVVMGVFFLTQGRRATALYLAGAAVPVCAILVQNRWIWGSWVTSGYAQTGLSFGGVVPHALVRLLFGWWRGLFVYSPVLILAVVGWILALRSPRGFVERRLAFLGAACVATIVLYAAHAQWWGGLNQFGYRFLLDIVPMLVVLCTWAVARRPALRSVALPLAVVSIMTMSFGMASNRFGWDGVMFPRGIGDSPIGQAWIVFLDHPAGGLLRLLGVAVVAALIALVAARVEGRASTGLA